MSVREKSISTELEKVTLNLYRADTESLRRLYGYGWSEQVRDWVREKVAEKITVKVTVGDLPDGQ